MATMTDVARLARVSVSTVSYVLTGTRPISEATRERVLAAMAELDYQPNAMARGLASRRTTLLGLMMPMDERGMGATETAFVTGAAAAASAAGRHLILQPDPADDLEALRQVAGQGLLDGALLMEVRLDDPRVALLTELGVAFVLLGRTRDTTGLAYVDIDFDQTVGEAVDHLVGLGHRDIVFVNHSQASLDAGYGPALRSAEAFRTAMQRHGLAPVMVPSDDSASGGRAALAAALDRLPGLTGVLALNESALFGVLGGLTERGLRVPDDVSVVSMVTSPAVADLSAPPLTSMVSPGSAMGRLGVETLLSILEREGAPAPPRQQLLPCSLQVRGTSGPVRG